MYLPIIFGLVAIYSLGLMFSLAGAYFIQILIDKLALPKPLFYIFGYFAGLTVFLSIWRVFDFVLKSASFGFFMSVLLLFILSYLYLKKNCIFLSRSFVKLSYFLFLALVIQILCTMFWTREVYTDAFSTLGSGHSPRYANITLHVIAIDRIPAIGLNYVQSLLSAIPIFLGGESPLVYLSLWLGLSLFLFSLMNYYLFRWFGFSKTISILGAIILNFGNTAVSIRHHLVLDTGSPFFLAAYSDTLHSIGIMVLATFITTTLVFKFEPKSELKKLVKIFIVLGCLFYSNTLMSPQGIAISCSTIGILFLYNYLSKSTSKKVRNYFFIPIGILVFTLLLGTQTGGFLTPISRQDLTVLPGVARIDSSDFRPEFSPSIPYYLGSYHNWIMATPETFLVKGEPFLEMANRLAIVIGQSLYVMFFPILGLVLTFFYRKKSPQVEILFYVSLIAFVVGLIIVWPLRIHGSKWMWTRFLIPGIYFAQSCFCIGLFYFSSLTFKKIQNAINILIVLFICWGPFVNFYQIIDENFKNSQEFSKRIKSMVDYSKIPDR